MEVARCYKYIPSEFNGPDYMDIYHPKLMAAPDYSSFLRELQRQEGLEDYLNVYVYGWIIIKCA